MRKPRHFAKRYSSSTHPRARLRVIEQVAVGDLVWAWESTTRAHFRRRVAKTFVHRDQAVLAIVCRSARGLEQTLCATPDHPFWVAEKGWVAANRLVSGDLLQHLEPDSGQWRIARVVDEGWRADVYNFEVEGLHNYHVGAGGLLVHNESSLPRFDPDGPPVHDHHPRDPHTEALEHLDQVERQAANQKWIRHATRAFTGLSFGLALYGAASRVQKGLADARAHIEMAEAQRTTPPQWAVDYEVQMQRAALQVQFDRGLRLMEPAPQGPQLSLTTPLQRFYGHLMAEETARGELSMQLDADRALVRSRPIELAEGGKLIRGKHLWNRDRIVPLEGGDYEVAEAKVRLKLSEGDHRGARALADDGGLYLGDYNRLFEQAYRPRVESTTKQAARLLLTDPLFQSDLADYGGRMIAASPLGKAPWMTGSDGSPAQERGRMFVSSTIQIGKAISESITIARDGRAGYSDATTVSQVWADAAANLSGRAIANMGSEQAGMFLPSPAKGSVWSRPIVQFAGMWATDSALSAGSFIARDAFMHHVDPSRPSPFAKGWAAAVVPDFAGNAMGYPIFYASALGGNAFGGPYAGALWKGSLLTGARQVGTWSWEALAEP